MDTSRRLAPLLCAGLWIASACSRDRTQVTAGGDCATSADCDDGQACNGMETCSGELLCVGGTPIACESHSTCAEPAGECVCEVGYAGADCDVCAAGHLASGLDCVACGRFPGRSDHHNLSSSGNIAVTAWQSPGQSFRVGSAGWLVGIELALVRCTAQDGEAVTIDVYDAAWNALGRATLDGAVVPGPGLCGVVPDPIDPTSVGSTSVDLSGSCISVSPGVTYHFEVTGGALGSCDRGTRTCVTGHVGPCFSDLECSTDFRLGTSGNAYADGTLLANRDAIDGDLAFKLLIE